MKEFIKKYYKNLILVIIYLVLANLVYVILANEIWHRWYLDIIVGLVVSGFGIYLGFLYIRSEIRAEEKKNKEANEQKLATPEAEE